MAYLRVDVQEISSRNVFTNARAFDGMTMAFDGDGSDFGCEIPYDARDDKYLILIHNAGSESANITVKGGNALQGGKDLTFVLDEGKFTLLQPDSGRFKNVDGEYKGKVVITAGSANVKVAVFRLP